MKHSILLSGALGLLLAAPFAMATTEARIGIDQRMVMESNIFRQPANERSDGTYALTPMARLGGRGKSYEWDARYNPSYQVYFTTDELKGWNHDGQVTASYDISPKDRLSLEFVAYQHRNIFTAFAGNIVTQPDLLTSNLGTVERLQASVTYQRYFGPRIVTITQGFFDQYDFTKSTALGNVTGGASLQALYLPSQKIKVGANAVFRHTQFESRGLQEAARTVSGNFGAVVDYQVTPHTAFKLSGGPALIENRRAGGLQTVYRYLAPLPTAQGAVLTLRRFDPANCANNGFGPEFWTCPLVTTPNTLPNVLATVPIGYLASEDPARSDGLQWTFFAEIGLTHEFSDGRASFTYSRSEDSSSGISGGSVRDSVRGVVSYRPWPLWEFGANVSWTRRVSEAFSSIPRVRAGDSGIPSGDPGFNFAEAVSLIPELVKNDAEVIQIWAETTGRRRITKNFDVSASFRFVREDQRSAGTNSGVRDDFVGTLSVKYEFEPFRF